METKALPEVGCMEAKQEQRPEEHGGGYWAVAATGAVDTGAVDNSQFVKDTSH